jgi:hypothetical protein
MRPGRVFVGENFDDQDPANMWPGRWSAHWESDDPKLWTQGPQGVSAQDAIAWGREQADVVLIRPGDTDVHYSAGSVEEQDCPRWPNGQELARRRDGERPDDWPSLPSTRNWTAAVLVEALRRAGAGRYRIDLPDLWPAITAWWSTPVTDLGPSDQQLLRFLLALAPTKNETGRPVFAGTPPEEIAGQELVRLDFRRRFENGAESGDGRALSGGATVTFWYPYGDAWRRLRERSSWIEMGLSTPQIDLSSPSNGGVADLIQRITVSGVLDAAARQPALALTVDDVQHDHWLSVVRHQ